MINVISKGSLDNIFNLRRNSNMSKSTKIFNIEVEDNIIKTPDIDFQCTEGLGTASYRKLNEFKDGIFQINADTGETDSNGDFLRRSVRTAIAMRARGVVPNDIITVCSSSHMNTCTPIFASFFIGAVPANIDPKLPVSDQMHLISLVEPKVIFVSSEVVELVELVLANTGIKSEIVVFGDTEKHSRFVDFLKESEEERNFKPYKTPDPNETAIICFSSGTSGLSKGICLNHSTFMMNLETTATNGAPFPNAVLLSSSLVYWITYTLGALLALFRRMSRLVISKFESETIWDIIEKFKVRILILAPTQLATMLESSHSRDKDLSSVFLILFGGSSFSEEQIMKLRGHFPNAIVLYGYGLTETGGSGVTFDPLNEYDLQLLKTKPVSSGRPVRGNTYKIVDPDTEQALGPNQEGELRIKNKYQMNGYYKINSSEQWDSDGFLKTGDAAYYDDDYCFYIVGRYKEMIKYQGVQITPVKLEYILRTHTAVQEVVVLGKPHPIDVEHLIALVVLKAEYKDKISSEELKEYYEAKVEDLHKLRGGLKFIEKVLKNSAGKVKRREMLKLLLDNKI